MRKARDCDDDLRIDAKADYPLMVRLAAIAWLAFGCLIVVNAVAGAVLNVVVMVATPPRPAGPLAPPRPGQPIVNAQAGSDAEIHALVLTGLGTGIAIVIGGSLVFAGVQTVRGAAKDTLGNAIGVIDLGVLNLGCGGAVIAAGFGLRGVGTVVAIIIGVLSVAVGLGLVTSAVLALVGRTQYLAWQRARGRRR